MNHLLSHYVLVYGSLRNGEYNHHYLARAKLITMLHIPHFSMVSMGAYPAIYQSDNPSGILCELYQIDIATFADLDMLEGYPVFYNRTQVELTLAPDREPIYAWIYYMEKYELEHRPHIENGDWVASH